MLSNLPIELLSNIVAYLPNAQTIHHLSRTCHALNAYVQKEGWKVFCRSNFPSIYLDADTDWQGAAQALTAASRNWDRRAFLARYLEPSGSVTDVTTWKPIPKWRRPRGQTMGYRPVLDSYEESTGPSWSARREVLAWSAGASLVVRVKQMGPEIADFFDRSSPMERDFYYDDRGHMISWFTYAPPGSQQGRDDITALRVLKPHQKDPQDGPADKFIIGTASGNLSVLNIDLSGHTRKVTTTKFETNGRQIRSADTSSSTSPLLSAVLDDADITLYRIPSGNDTSTVSAITDIPKLGSGFTGRVWTTSFLSNTRLAVSLGPSLAPLRIYEVGCDGIAQDPLRKFGLKDGIYDDKVEEATPTPRNTSSSTVYPIIPLPPSSQASRAVGELFFSGGFDGIVRLHDMRSPQNYVSTYADPAEDAAIFSLISLGRERIVAGNSRNCLIKVFDLRMAGGRIYHYLNATASQSETIASPAPKHPPTVDWNLFMNPRNLTSSHNTTWLNRWTRRTLESPVYSLSTPSFASPSLFAGVENNVVQLDFVSMLDRHPDPVFNPQLQHGRRIPRYGPLDAGRIWNPRGQVLEFAIERWGFIRGNSRGGMSGG
ncbi:hypothetical protein M501DRAFT_1054614 [Patellaria atrata CBS 101060]|uniref:F-box domain-containing protein n=1 Tax=Patellaria atrata CBS 101060 TaxID=1346257 RepID=A0A9P4SGE8_9PEZI|nr:hypothetical protein M501DRAFT_1054614 [Patellaria atrata CBS 101060]